MCVVISVTDRLSGTCVGESRYDILLRLSVDELFNIYVGYLFCIWSAGNVFFITYYSTYRTCEFCFFCNRNYYDWITYKATKSTRPSDVEYHLHPYHTILLPSSHPSITVVEYIVWRTTVCYHLDTFVCYKPNWTEHLVVWFLFKNWSADQLTLKITRIHHSKICSGLHLHPNKPNQTI